ncbi:MAG: hypothetical protein QNJ97_22310 [Myxococcota bacterium]|nr:hypothetical protein [Myxococcota bacterium]
MYDFVRGPMVWLAFSIFVIGIAYRVFLLLRLTHHRQLPSLGMPSQHQRPHVRQRTFAHRLGRFAANSIFATAPVTTVVSLVFHFCVIVTPLIVVGHSVSFLESWGVSLPSVSDAVGDGLTVVCLATAAMLLARRMVIPHVRSLSAPRDYLYLMITIAPFLTGYLAYHQLIAYEAAITLHILTGEVLLIAISVTKLGHMIFFFFARFFVSSEYSFGSGSRQW